jgi:NAD(P)H-hydrate repair Nnr-like enzyme with NAD(P)H-hydrate epimerase domain
MLAPLVAPSAPEPQRVFAAIEPWPLHDCEATRRIESRALARCAPQALMARAGLAVARLAQAVAPHARHITVLAGPGNNGGDGLIAALHLHRQGRQVQVVHLADPARLPADAADALRKLVAARVPLRGELPRCGTPTC